MTTLAGVEDVHLEGDSIVGRWKPKQELRYITNQKKVKTPNAPSAVERFVNIDANDRQSILRFVTEYGPLEQPLEPGGLAFRQPLKDWREYQAWVRARLWSQSLGYTVGMQEGDGIHFEAQGKVSAISLSSLKRFLEFEIFSAPRARRRVCARAGCGTYFIAERKDSRLCGTPLCAAEIRKEFMRDWWKRKGKQWRERRRKKMKKRRKV